MNKSLVGTVEGDPDVRYTRTGDPVVKVILATFESYRDKSGECQDRIRTYTVVFSKHLAETAAERLRPGSRVRIDCDLIPGTRTGTASDVVLMDESEQAS